jgi:hypothetical protein
LLANASIPFVRRRDLNVVDTTKKRFGPLAYLAVALGCAFWAASAVGVGGASLYAARHRAEIAHVARERLYAGLGTAAVATASQTHASSAKESNLAKVMAQPAAQTPDAFASTVIDSEATTVAVEANASGV